MNEIMQTTLFKPKLDIWNTEASNSMIDNLIANHHYSKKATQNRWKSFAVYYKGMLSGGMQIGYGIRPKMKEHIIRGAISETVKEFDRMWLSDSMPKNSESKCIGYLLRYLRKKYPELKVLISYADGLRDKIGTIYQATNFVYIGAIKGEFYYIPSKDDWVHPVSMYHMHGTRAIDTLRKIYPDIQHIRGLQYRYLYFLDPLWLSRLNVPIKSYPKRGDSSLIAKTSSDHEEDVGANPNLSHNENLLKKGGILMSQKILKFKVDYKGRKMNKQELKEAIEKSDIKTETKTEIIEIVELLDFEKARAREANKEIESDTMNELLRFLEGKFKPKTVALVEEEKLPKLTTIQAWFVIYVLQEHFKILPDKFELCDECGRIFDSEIEGIHTDNKVQFGDGEIAYGLPIEDLGKMLCGYCEDVHRIREYAKDVRED